MFIEKLNVLNGIIFQVSFRFYVLAVLVCVEAPFIRDRKRLFFA